MIKRLAAFLAFALIRAAASAAPVITSITPSSSTVNGGIHITIKGSGFADCPICSPPVPPVVGFGLTDSSSVRVLDPQTLDVVVPVHLPGMVDVNVVQFDGTATAPNAFTFTGQVSDAFETILLPIFSPPVHGAFGSEFHTIVRAANKSDTLFTIYGVDTSCTLIDPPQYPTAPFAIVGARETQLLTDCSQWPARFLFVDVTRTASSHGTEIPIIRSSQMTSRTIVLLDVPEDAVSEGDPRDLRSVAGCGAGHVEHTIIQRQRPGSRLQFRSSRFTNRRIVLLGVPIGRSRRLRRIDVILSREDGEGSGWRASPAFHRPDPSRSSALRMTVS